MTLSARILALLLALHMVVGSGALDLCGCGPGGHGRFCDASAAPDAEGCGSAEVGESAPAARGSCCAPEREPAPESSCCAAPAPPASAGHAPRAPAEAEAKSDHEECACPALEWNVPVRDESPVDGGSPLASAAAWCCSSPARPRATRPACPRAQRPPNAPPDGVRLHLFLGVWTC